MLKTVDVLIGLSLVMLLGSVLVMTLTQLVVSLTNMRGLFLMRGLARLITQIDPALAPHAEVISAEILKHPMVANANGKMADVIQREELMELLLEFAAGQSTDPRFQSAIAAVRTSFQRAGIQDPAQALDAVHLTALQLEAARPELADSVRRSTAMIQAAGCRLVGEVHAWFDQSMDRVTHAFTANLRFYTFAFSFLVAFSLNIDTISVLQRLSVDESVRKLLVEQAANVMVVPDPAGKANDFDSMMDRVPATVRQLALTGLIPSPWSFPKTYTAWMGLLLSTVLMAMGAPFWFSAIQRLLQFRSNLAARDDVARTIRATTQIPDTEPIASATIVAPTIQDASAGNG